MVNAEANEATIGSLEVAEADDSIEGSGIKVPSFFVFFFFFV